MTNADCFFESFTNVEHTILGRKLKPFSLLHLIWLYQINSPLVYTSLKTTLADLEIAALICSGETNEHIVKEIGKKQSKWKRITRYLWRCRNKKRDFEAELKKFIAYNDDYISLPKFFPKDEKESNESLPWFLLHAAALIRQTGWAEQTVFSMPVGKIIWFNLAFGYLESGNTSIMSEKEQAAAAALQAMALTGSK